MRPSIVKEEIVLKRNLTRAKRHGVVADLTIGEWIETLEYFNYSCAYCGRKYEVLEHYIPVETGGTTIGNCIPACKVCNFHKDANGIQHLDWYKNFTVINFLVSKGASIYFHIHEFEYKPANVGGFTFTKVTCACGWSTTIASGEDGIKEYLNTRGIVGTVTNKPVPNLTYEKQF